MALSTWYGLQLRGRFRSSHTAQSFLSSSDFWFIYVVRLDYFSRLMVLKNDSLHYLITVCSSAGETFVTMPGLLKLHVLARITMVVLPLNVMSDR